MSNDGQNQNESLLTDLYKKGGHLYSSRTADGFEAFHKRTNDRSLLWILRYPLTPDSDAARQFLKRLSTIERMGCDTPRFREYGVDSRGAAYLAMEVPFGRSVFEFTTAVAERERIFIQLLRTLVPLHQEGIVLGDICDDSFRVNERGKPVLVALMGSFDLAARRTAMLPPSDTLHYLAPEQRGGMGPEPASDIYALGVLAYRLFTGESLSIYRGADRATVDVLHVARAPSRVGPDVPSWADEIIGQCLELEPKNRFSDVSELLAAIEDSVAGDRSAGDSSRWARRDESPRSSAVQTFGPSSDSTPVVRSDNEPSLASASLGPSLSSKFRLSSPGKVFLLWAGALVVALSIVTTAFLLLEDGGGGRVAGADSICVHAEYAPLELQTLIESYCSSSVTLDDRRETLDRISRIEDPISLQVLISVANDEQQNLLRSAAQRLLVDRIKRRGLQRSSEVVERWFQALGQAGHKLSQSAVYSSILEACDPTRTVETRREALRGTYEKARVVGLQLAASLSLDEKDHELFAPVLREFLSKELQTSDLEGKSILALVLSHRTLTSLFFDREIAEAIEGFTDDELSWSVVQLAKYDSPLLYDVSREILRRGTLSPMKEVFLKALMEVDRVDISRAVQRSLIKGAVGEITELDLRNFADWYAFESEPVFLSICALSKDKDVVIDAFDILAARTIRDPVADKLVRWIKADLWDLRGELTEAVGILGLLKIATPGQIDRSFKILLPYARSGNLLSVFVATKNPRLIVESLERVGAITPSSRLLSFLTHENLDVRIAAIRGLKDRNEVNTLQSIYRAFEREQNPKVKAAYREIHWVTRRESRMKRNRNSRTRASGRPLR